VVRSLWAGRCDLTENVVPLLAIDGSSFLHFISFHTQPFGEAINVEGLKVP
jgi:hypothetical protein